MGTLFDQRPRVDSLDCYFGQIWEALEHVQADPDKDATPEEIMTACRMVEVALKVQTADVLDEQLAGFGKILISLAEAMTEIAEAIKNRD